MALFLSKPRLDSPRKKKKIFVPNSVPTRPGKEDTLKNSNKIQKIKKLHSASISVQTGFRLAKKEKKKKISSRIPFLPDPDLKILKKIAKKNLKLHSSIISIKIGLKKREKKFCPEFRSYPTHARKFPKK